jgi:hypothetical protein
LKGLACQTGETNFINDSCLNKLWVHRVDSKERYQVLKGKFAGYETDITWNSAKKQFFVYHPPLDEEPITLQEFLSVINLDSTMLWLDTREIPVADTSAVLQEFNKFPLIKMNAIVELYDTTVANYLAKKDYWVALNINNEWIRKFKDDDWKRLRETMSLKISFVSQEGVHLPLLKEKFPDKDIITWSIAFKNYFNTDHLKELVKDEKVKVVLVNIKSKHYK